MKKNFSYLPNGYQLTLIFLNLPRPFLWFLLHYGFCKLLSACTILLHPATGGQALFQPKHIHLVTNDRRRIRRRSRWVLCDETNAQKRMGIIAIINGGGLVVFVRFGSPLTSICHVLYFSLYYTVSVIYIFMYINNIYHIAIDISSA